MSKPLGVNVGLSVTRPNRAEDAIWDAVEEAQSYGMTELLERLVASERARAELAERSLNDARNQLIALQEDIAAVQARKDKNRDRMRTVRAQMRTNDAQCTHAPPSPQVSSSSPTPPIITSFPPTPEIQGEPPPALELHRDPLPEPPPVPDQPAVPKPKRRRQERDPYPAEFDLLWDAYPRRAGGNPKLDAWKAVRVRLDGGESYTALQDGTNRYTAYCIATDKIDTEFVMQASRFYGPSQRYAEPWGISAPQGKKAELEVDEWGDPTYASLLRIA